MPTHYTSLPQFDRGVYAILTGRTPEATFAAQAEPLADVHSLQQYTDWMQALLRFVPDGRYQLKSFATDEQRKNVAAYAVFVGTHTGEGGPCSPTGRAFATDYVFT